jgi:hypothetical protein
LIAPPTRYDVGKVAKELNSRLPWTSINLHGELSGNAKTLQRVVTICFKATTTPLCSLPNGVTANSLCILDCLSSTYFPLQINVIASPRRRLNNASDEVPLEGAYCPTSDLLLYGTLRE